MVGNAKACHVPRWLATFYRGQVFSTVARYFLRWPGIFYGGAGQGAEAREGREGNDDGLGPCIPFIRIGFVWLASLRQVPRLCDKLLDPGEG